MRTASPIICGPSRRTAIAAAAAAALLAGAPAWAASTASASLGPFSITLIDLNLDDAIAPSITFNNPYGYGSYADAYAADYFNGQNSGAGNYGPAPWAPVSAATSGVDNAWATSGVTGSGSADGSTLFASGTALGTGTNDPLSGHSSYFQGAAYGDGVSQSFTLSANTLLVVSAQSVLGTDVTHVWDPALAYGWEYAYAYTSIQLSGPGPGGGGSQGSSDGASLVVNSMYYDTSPPCVTMTDGYCYGPSSASDSRMLSVSFVNFTGASMDGWIYSYAQVYGQSYAPAVPEPTSAALLLAGLAATAGVVRRHRRQVRRAQGAGSGVRAGEVALAEGTHHAP